MKTKLALIALILTGAHMYGAVLSPVVNPANGHSYYLLAPSTWTASQAEAVALGGNLATINDAAENDWVFDTFSEGQRNLWIGLNDIDADQNYTWIDGTVSSYFNWDTTGDPQPNKGTEHWVFMARSDALHNVTARKWHDVYDDAVGAFPWLEAVYGVVEVAPVRLLNGSFETPALAKDAVIGLPAGDNTLPGWTVGGTGAGMILGNGNFPNAIGAADGEQCVIFSTGTYPSGGKISQTFSTQAGRIYRVTLSVGKIGWAPAAVSVLASVKADDGTVLGSMALNKTETGWLAPTTFRFTAAGGKSTLIFEDTTAQPLNVDLALDAVSVEPISPTLEIAVRSVNVCWGSVTGILYQLQKRVELLGETVWANVGDPIPGTGNQICVEQPVEGTVGFYRLREIP